MGTSSSTPVTTAANPYTLQQDYLAGGNFFNNFNFFTGSDPTHGFVQYLNQSQAQAAGMLMTNANAAYIGTDNQNVQPNGRPSVRIQSKAIYNAGLIILDLFHMPGGACGTWPAFWSLGPNWPNNGEIDIIEGVNQNPTNLMSLHTAQGCNITSSVSMQGSVQTSDCWVADPNQSGNAGCGIATSNTSTYGAGFNAIGGGVYATRYTSSNVTIWFFPRKYIPSDISSGNPNPAGWGVPMATFSGCNIGQYVQQQSLIFDLTFCGDWAGNVWSSGSCASQASTCQAYVANNPSAFDNTYWWINGLKVYQHT